MLGILDNSIVFKHNLQNMSAILDSPGIPQFSINSPGNSPFPIELEIPQISKNWRKILPVGIAAVKIVACGSTELVS